MPGCFRHVLWDEGLELGLGFLVVEKGLPGGAEDRRELGPRIRARHVDDPHRRKARARRIDPEQPRGLAILDATPEFALGGYKQALIQRIRRNRDLDPFAAASDDRERRE